MKNILLLTFILLAITHPLSAKTGEYNDRSDGASTSIAILNDHTAYFIFQYPEGEIMGVGKWEKIKEGKYEGSYKLTLQAEMWYHKGEQLTFKEPLILYFFGDGKKGMVVNTVNLTSTSGIISTFEIPDLIYNPNVNPNETGSEGNH